MAAVLNLEGVALRPEDAKFRRLAERIGKEVLAPHAADVDRGARYPNEAVRALRQSGLLGLLLPKSLGGQEGSIMASCLVTESLAKYCASTAIAYNMHQAGMLLLMRMATPEQAQRFLPAIAEGTQLLAYASSEPGSGNRIWHMDSFARAQGDELVVDSFKSICTSAGKADSYLVPVRAHPEAGRDDLSLFLIEGTHPGIDVKDGGEAMGLRGSCSKPIHFRGCALPKVRRIGAPSAAFSFMMAYSLPTYLVGLSACYLGIAQSAMDAAVEHVKRRVHSDTKKTLANVETVQRYVAEMRVRVDGTRALLYRVARMADAATRLFDELERADLLDGVVRDNPDDPLFIELASTKVAACEMAVEVAHRALQVCGGAAYVKGHPVERAYRDARAGSLMGPADDTLKVTIGLQMVGLPQPWA